MFTGAGLIAFLFIFGVALLGFYIGEKLPDDHRTDATQRTVQGATNILGVLSALVLGLLIAGTKTNYDTRSREVQDFATSLVLLDHELRLLGPPGEGERDILRNYAARKRALMWPSDYAATPMVSDAQTAEMLDAIDQWLRAWSPQTDADHLGRANALSIVAEIQRANRLLAVQETSRTPAPYLYAVVVWVAMLFLGNAIFAPRNAVAIAAFVISAFSMATAINLILDTDRPFLGFIRTPEAAMRQALELLRP